MAALHYSLILQALTLLSDHAVAKQRGRTQFCDVLCTLNGAK